MTLITLDNDSYLTVPSTEGGSSVSKDRLQFHLSSFVPEFAGFSANTEGASGILVMRGPHPRHESMYTLLRFTFLVFPEKTPRNHLIRVEVGQRSGGDSYHTSRVILVSENQHRYLRTVFSQFVEEQGKESNQELKLNN